MQKHSIIVIGASAGGVEALIRLVRALPADLPAAIFVVLHLPPMGTSVLPQILNRKGNLRAQHPTDRTPIVMGEIYVAPPDFHLIVRPGQMRLSRDARENGFRPAIDVTFRSAAHAYDRQVIGVILSGALDDGTAGLAIVKSAGGITLVQDPTEALFDGMPRSAIANVEVDQVLRLNEIAVQIVHLTHTPIDQETTVTEDELEHEAEIVAHEKAEIEQGERQGSASTFTCPDCGGVLWELGRGKLLRYRCHVGHAYSVNSLMSKQADSVELALWTALRALEEKAALARRMATQARQQNQTLSETRFSQKSEEIEAQAALVRQVILQQTQGKQEESQDLLEQPDDS